LLQVFEQISIRKGLYSLNARSNIFQTLIGESLKMFCGFVWPTSTSLISIASIKYLIHGSVFWLGLKKVVDLRQIRKNILSENKNKLLFLFKKYKDFPKFRAPQLLINSVSQGFPVLLLLYFYGPVVAGYYTLSKTVVSMPTALVGKSVADVFYPRVVRAVHNNENIVILIFKAMLVLGIAGLIPLMIIFLEGPQLFSIIFGDRWVVAGEYSKWLSLWTFVGLMNRPCAQVLPAINAQRSFLYIEFFSVCLRTFVLFVGFYVYSSDVVSVALFGLTGALINIVFIIVVISKTLSYEKGKKYQDLAV